MDPNNPTSEIFAKIITLEPDNATKIFGYLLLQDLDLNDIIRMAFGPDILVQNFCQKAKSELVLLGFSLNPNFDLPPLSQSSPRNGFLNLSRNPNLNFSSDPFPESSYSSRDFADEQQQQMINDYSLLNNEDPFANLHNDACLESEGQRFEGAGYRFPQAGLVDDFGSSGGFISPSERGQEKNIRLQSKQKKMVAAPFMAEYESQMAQRQGTRYMKKVKRHENSKMQHLRDRYDCHLGTRMSSNKTHEMSRREANQQDVIQQQAVESSLSFGSTAHFPTGLNHSPLFQSQNNMEEGGYSNQFYNGQGTRPEIRLPDSLFDSPKRSGETEQKTEQNKAASSDQSMVRCRLVKRRK